MRFVVTSDRINGKEQTYINRMIKFLKANGHEAVSAGVGPNKIQSAMLGSSVKNSVGVQIVGGMGLGTITDCMTGIKNGYYHADYFMSVGSYEFTHKTLLKTSMMNTKVTSCEPGMSSVQCNLYKGMTPNQWNNKYGEYAKIIYRDTFDECLQEMIGGGGVSSESQDGTPRTITSEMLSGEWTYQEIISEICNGIDLLFLCKRNTAVVTDMETLYAEAEYLREKGIAKHEDLSLWQLEQDSYDMNVNQYGFYNTVKVVYNKGTWIESYSDLVNIFGEVPITYTHKNLNKTQAKQKAKAYLAAHLRDFNMELSATILHDGGIDIGDIITLDNPLTLRDASKNNKEYMFVKGLSADWEGDSPITYDLELLYAPESPERPEIPETGTNGYYNSGSGDTNSACWNKWWNFAKNSVWSHEYRMHDPHDPTEAYKNFKNNNGRKQWDCFSSTAFLYYVLNFLCKVPTRDIVSSSSVSQSGTHHVVQCKIDGEWQFPSEYDSMPEGLHVNSQMRSGKYQIFRSAPSDLNSTSYPAHK